MNNNEHHEARNELLWGVATSSYQIEGATDEDGRGPSIWDVFCDQPGRIDDGSDGSVACDHYHRWAQDLDLIQRLGVGAYRFSIAWPRILPEGVGKVETRGLDFYDRLVDGLLERRILPFATLYHWDLPQALEDRGGWLNRDVVAAFTEYAQVVTARLGDRVHAWTTLNEPWCSAHLGYGVGEHAPGHRDRSESLLAAHHLLLAHGSALPVMRSNAPGAKHGIVLNLNPAYAATDSDEDRRAARRFDAFFNRWYLDPIFTGTYPEDAWAGYGPDVPNVEPGDLETINAPLDFLGVNYYSRTIVRAGAGPWPATQSVPGEGPPTDMGWEVYPAALEELLLRVQREYGPQELFITENGAAYPDRLQNGRVEDEERIAYLREHIAAVERARGQGAAVSGYFAWSLMDNFEWARGYRKRFGLVYVDYETQVRTPKASAHWYSQHIRSSKAKDGESRPVSG